MSRCKVRPLKASEVEFTIECLPEEIPVEGNAMASGDEAADRECEAEIYRQLEAGNEWAWCTVRVVATYGDFEGDDYLGGCSYESEKDFSHPSGYLPQMKEEALARLNERIATAAKSLPLEVSP